MKTPIPRLQFVSVTRMFWMMIMLMTRKITTKIMLMTMMTKKTTMNMMMMTIAGPETATTIKKTTAAARAAVAEKESAHRAENV